MRPVVVLLTFPPLSSSLHILVYLTLIAKSHLDFTSTLINKLTERGHTVDLVLARLNSAVHSNGTHNARHILSTSFPSVSPWNTLKHTTSPFELMPDQTMLFSTTWSTFFSITHQLCHHVLNDSSISSHLSTHSYDIALVSNYDGCPLALTHRHGIHRIVTFSSLPTAHFDLIHSGIPNLPAFETDSMHKNVFRPFDHTSFWHRIRNFIRSVITMERDTRNMMRDTDNVIRSHYGHGFPSIYELGKKVFYEFANSNLILEEPRLNSQRIKFIGGIGYNKAEKIKDEKLLDILSSSNKGVVVIALGSQVSSSHYPPYVIAAFLHSITILKEYTFIWKFEGDLGIVPSNLHLVDWLPQAQLLQDPRVIAFVSHMGMNSFVEAAYSGVPIVAIPLFADQTHNAHNVNRLHNGVLLNKPYISNHTMLMSIRSILEEERYGERAKEIAEMLRIHPENPERTFIETLEFAAKVENLDAITRLHSSDLHWLQTIGFDIAVSLTLLSVVFLYSSIRLLSFLLLSTKKSKME